MKFSEYLRKKEEENREEYERQQQANQELIRNTKWVNADTSLGNKIGWVGKNFISGAQGGVLNTISAPFQSMATGFNRGAKQSEQEQNIFDKLKNTGKNAIKNIAYRDVAGRLIYDATLGREDTFNRIMQQAQQLQNNYNQVQENARNTNENPLWTKVKQAGMVIGGATSSVTQDFNPVAQELYNAGQYTGQILGKDKAEQERDKLLKIDENINKNNDEWQEQLAKQGEFYGKGWQTVGGASQSVGNMTPSILLGMVTGGAGASQGVSQALSMAQLGLSAKGQETRKSLKQGADLETAERRGIASGTAEVGSEFMFEGLKPFKTFRENGIEDVAKKYIADSLENKLKSEVGKKLVGKLANAGIDIAGETVEEWTTDIYNTWLDRATIDPNAEYTLEQAMETALSTGAINTGYSAINTGLDKIYKRNQDNVNNKVEITPEVRKESNDYKTTLQGMVNNLDIPQQIKDEIQPMLDSNAVVTKEDFNGLKESIKDIVKNNGEIQKTQLLEQAYNTTAIDNQIESLNQLTPEKFNNQESRQFYAQQMNKPLTYNVDTILDAYPENRNGKRTVRQWKDMSKQIGTQMAIDGLSIDEVRANAVGLWQQLEPSKNITRYDNQEHKNKGFDKLNNEIWTKGIYDSYKETMKTQLEQQQEQATSEEVLNPQLEAIDDNTNILLDTIDSFNANEQVSEQVKESLVESAERYGFKGKTLNEIQKAMEKRGINSRFDDTQFNDNRVGSFYDPDNNEIVFNPNASEEQIIQELAVHEWYHELKQNNTEEAKKIQEDIINYLKRNNQYADIRKNLEKTYIEQGYDKNRPDFTDMIDEEATAKALQQVLGNEEEIQRLNSYNRSLARRIYDAVVNLLNKFTGGRNEKLFWTNVRNNFERVFNTPGTVNQNNQSNNQKRLSTDTESQEQGSFNLPENIDYEQNINLQSEVFNNYKIYDIKNEVGEKRFNKFASEHYSDFNDWRNSAVEYQKEIGNLVTNYYNIDDNLVKLTTTKEGNKLYIDELYVEKQGQGTGTKVIEALKQYAEKSGLTLETSDELGKAKGFWDKVLNRISTTDNQGRTLTKEQQEYFKDSKVRDKDGNLIEVYHGTNNDFNEFDSTKFGKYTGKLKGIWLTDKIINANAYGNNIIQSYVNITNPGSATEVTMNKEQYSELLKNAEVKDTNIDSSWEYFKDKNDFDILTHIQRLYENKGKTLQNFYDDVINTTGIDGIYDEKYLADGSPVWIAFNSNQVKKISNTNPTSNPDIRYSVSTDNTNNRFDVTGNENLAESGTVFFRTRPDGDYYVQATNNAGDLIYEGTFIGKKDMAKTLGEDVANYIINNSEENNNELYIENKGNKPKDYKMWHRPSQEYGDGSNFEANMSGVFEHPEWYMDMSKTYNKESLEALRKVRNNPDAEITVYRATPGNDINPGDWITPSKKYAEFHNESQLDGKGNIVEKKIKVNEMLWGGDDINEFGYYPEENTKYSKQANNFDKWVKDNIGKYADKGKRTTLGELKLSTKQEVKAPTKQVKLSEETTPTVKETYENVPTKNNQKQRKAYKSIIESEFTTKEAKQIAYDYLNSDTYVPDSNKEQLERADKRIERNGIEQELDALETNVNEGKKITAEDIAVGDRLIKYYMTTGDKANLERSIRAMAMAGTQAGRTVQAFAMIRHQSPEGMAIWIQNSVDKLNSNLKGKQQFEFTPEMQEKILNSNSENLQENVDEVMKELGQQVPVDFLGKLDAWRYFSMLGNPKTHIRNIVGNFAMAQTQKVKSKIAGTIEQVTGQDRTHTSIFERRNRKAIEFAKQDFQNADVKALLGIGTSKYTNPKNMIQQNQRTFKSDLLEKTLGRLFNINDKLLEGEDNFGLKNAYIRNLSDYMTANKLTAENMTGEQLQQARKMAVEESLRATFHQASSLATTLNQIEQKNLFSRIAMGGLVPFKKTPINVAKTGFTYSPVGLAKTILSDTVKLRQGKINVNEYIDNLSQGLTGTGIALLGYGLAEAGILKAGGDDDKEDKYKEAMGDQPYAITINGNSYSLDWLAPAGIPLFVGAELNKLVKDRAQEGEDEADTINELERVSRLFDASATLLNPMSEMSMISGLTSTLQTFATDPGQGLMNLGINPIKSYVGQMAPTSLGQIARSTDEYERDTSSTAKGMIAKAVDSTKNQVMNKIPGLRQKLPTKKDIWGDEVETQDYFHNAVLPYTKKEVKTNAVDKELNALYEKTGENIYPTTSLSKDVTYEGSKTRLTNKDYNEFKEAYGKNSYRILNSLVNSSEYKGMTDEQKVKAIKDVYTYANDLNKTNYANKKGISFETPTDVQQVNAIKQNGGSEADYFKYKGMVQGLSKDSEKMTALKDSKLSTNSKTAIYESILGKDDDFYQSTDNLLNINEYLGYKTAGLTSDKDENGKTIKNSLKNNKAEWINQNISGYENRLLLMAEDYKLSRAEQETLLGYINMQSNAEDIFNLLDKNYTVKNGRVYYK